MILIPSPEDCISFCACMLMLSKFSILYVLVLQRAGRIEDEIEMLQSKLKRMDEGIAFNGKRTKTARAQGKRVQITVEQERSRWIWQLLLSCLFDQNVLKGYMTFMSSIDAEY